MGSQIMHGTKRRENAAGGPNQWRVEILTFLVLNLYFFRLSCGFVEWRFDLLLLTLYSTLKFHILLTSLSNNRKEPVSSSSSVACCFSLPWMQSFLAMTPFFSPPLEPECFLCTIVGLLVFSGSQLADSFESLKRLWDDAESVGLQWFLNCLHFALWDSHECMEARERMLRFEWEMSLHRRMFEPWFPRG